MRASEWFHRWLKKHKKLNPHQQWALYEGGPDDRNEVYAGWIGRFDRHHIDERTALRASRRLQARPPGHPDKHLPALLDECAAIRAEDAAEAERLRRDRARADAAAEAARLDRLEQLWRQTTDRVRRDCTAAVEAEGNAITRWPSFRHRLCLDELERRIRRDRPARARA